MSSLKGRIALVTGGSRSVGRGVALGLSEAGATVYITGRTITDKVAAEVSAFGGRGIAVQCDHENDDAVKSVFETEDGESLDGPSLFDNACTRLNSA